MTRYHDDWDDEFASYDDGWDDDHQGTSLCPGTCVPQCAWCRVAHSCPEDCAGGTCPYDVLAREGSDG